MKMILKILGLEFYLEISSPF